MGKPVASGARLIAVGVALLGVSASLLVVQVNAQPGGSPGAAEIVARRRPSTPHGPRT